MTLEQMKGCIVEGLYPVNRYIGSDGKDYVILRLSSPYHFIELDAKLVEEAFDSLARKISFKAAMPDMYELTKDEILLFIILMEMIDPEAIK